MELDNNTINKILSEAKGLGYKLKVRDIAYVLLCRFLTDKIYAYRVCYGAEAKFSEQIVKDYDSSDAIQFLYSELLPVRDRTSRDDISFEENKAYMLKLKRETEEAINEGEIEKKDGLKILADLSVKLNDKFNIADASKDQVVIVNQKYNSVCEYCGHECATKVVPMSKEEAMKTYNLVESSSKHKKFEI